MANKNTRAKKRQIAKHVAAEHQAGRKVANPPPIASGYKWKGMRPQWRLVSTVTGSK
jgi:hypothetical protein